MNETQPIISAFLNQGLVGAVALVEGFVILSLWREIKGERAARDGEREKHREEINTLLERHIVKAETFAAKQTELADRVTAVLERATRRDDR